MPKKATKSFNDVMPKIEFYPDLPKVKLEDIMNIEVEVTDAKIIKDFTTAYGDHDFALLLLTTEPDGKQMTTICSGMVILKKVQYALDNKLLPLRATITKDAAYYDIA